eukprot:430314_1
MSQDQDHDQPKKQEESTPDKKSGSTKASEPEAAAAAAPISAKPTAPKNNEELIIEQVRSELEQYFAPQNIQNDFNLRQKMTTDGYIDIDLLLDLKLMQDLVSNRDILIEAITRSKLLVMNTGCTMVKYMPLLERNVLILRDIPTEKTNKDEIMAIFANEHCATPSEIHSDIGNNWFCQFKTEDECLKTAVYLQEFGMFHKEKLHVRVKAIHDKNKADTSPQMAPSPPIKPAKIPPQQAIPPPPQAPYSPGYYQSAGYGAYYGAQQGAPNPMDAYYYGSPPQRPVSPPKSSKRSATKDAKGKTKSKKDKASAAAAAEVTPPPEDEEDVEKTAMSDYPGVFDKYSQQRFIDLYSAMKEGDLVIPQSMRGRDFRIISEEVLVPIALQPSKDKESNKENVDEDDRKTQKEKKKKKKRRKKKEMSGTYYEDDMVYDERGGYDEAYYEEDYDASSYYYEDPYNENGAYYYNYETSGKGYGGQEKRERYYDDRRGGYYGANNQRKRRERGTGKKREQGQGQGQGQGQAKKGKGRGQKTRSGARGYTSQRSGNTTNKSSQSKKTGGVHWSPRQAKQYNTNKGVYRARQPATTTSSSAY